ncbi:MAG: sirohydrochlorin chelatase [Rhodospirillaceae bacterium]
MSASLPLAVVLCGHGTRHADGAAEFVAVADMVRAKLPHRQVGYGFLELSEPLLPDALLALTQQGHRRILVTPCMLFAAGHAKSDIPALLRTFGQAHPEVELIYGRTLGVDPGLLNAAAARINSVLDSAHDTSPLGKVPCDETLLLVIGRGSSDPDANADLAKITRMLWEGMGFGWGETGYFDVTFPNVVPAIDHATKLGYRRIVVFPYLLFTGVLVRRLREMVASARLRHPGFEFIEAPYLNDHPGVIEAFADRVEQAIIGDNAMNCRLCRHRTDILAFDRDSCHGHPYPNHPNGPGIGTA